MRGDTKVIEYLNAVLKGELTAVNQYWLHYRLLDNLGVKKLADYARHESIEEMQHADRLIARIFFLDGLPAMQALNRLRIGETVPEVLEADLALEHDAVALLRDAIQHCESVRDYPSRDLLAEILAAAGIADGESFPSWPEEKRLDFLNAELASSRPFLHDGARIGEHADNVLDTYRVLVRHWKRSGTAGLGSLIVSMTRQLSDLLAVYLLAREAGLMIHTPDGMA